MRMIGGLRIWRLITCVCCQTELCTVMNKGLIRRLVGMAERAPHACLINLSDFCFDNKNRENKHENIDKNTHVQYKKQISIPPTFSVFCEHIENLL